MADLILSKAEKAAPSYMDWDDASLGRAVRALISNIESSGKEADTKQEMLRLGASSAFFLLVGLAVNSNAATFDMEIEGVEVGVLGGGTKKVGKWRLELQQLTDGEFEETINDQVERERNPNEQRLKEISFKMENP